MAIQYSGGPIVDAPYASDGTVQTWLNWLEDKLNLAGWTTTSGHHTNTILLRSGTTPNGNGISLLLTISGSLAVFQIRNAVGSLVSQVHYVKVTNGFTYRIIAGPYQGFIWVPGSTAVQTSISFGVPYVPAFMSGTAVGEFGWILGDSWTDARVGPGFRTTFEPNSVPRYAQIVGSSLLDGSNAGIQPCPKLWWMYTNQYVATPTKFADGSYMIIEPWIGFGLASVSDPSVIRGQLWDAAILAQTQNADANLALDGHTFAVYTLGYANGALLLLSA